MKFYNGQWISGFACNLGSCSSEMAELHAVVSGIVLAWNSGCRNVILECDFTEVVNLISSSLEGNGVLPPCCFGVFAS